MLRNGEGVIKAFSLWEFLMVKKYFLTLVDMCEAGALREVK